MLKITHLAIKTVVALTLFTAASSHAANLCNTVWTGTVERVRVQEQATGETVMRLYIYPGNNDQYAGYTTSDFTADVLLKAKANMTQVTGYSDASCKIKWVDFK